VKKAIPNLLTLSNLLSGCIGVVFVFNTDMRYVSLMIGISLVFDFLDGMAARLLDVRSEIGKQLDSLADMVSFGLLPALIAYKILNDVSSGYVLYVPFLITLMSAYRLAKFNIDPRQASSFIGLPTPANAIFWASFPLIINGNTDTLWLMVMSMFAMDPIVIVICVALTSFLLVAEIPLFSFKFQNLTWKENKHRFIFLILSLILFISIWFYAIPFIIILYLILSIIQNQLKKKNEI
jgi:CDP-diacylglycerol--serine O-phosphatidyltransferase